MNRYMVSSPHTEEECAKHIAQVYEAGFITHFDWGCKGGEHCGWAIVEADSDQEALLSVPTIYRKKARATRLWQVSPEQAKEMHAELVKQKK